MTNVETHRLRRLAMLFASANRAAVAAVAATGIAVFVALGILQRTAYPTWLLANLDSEVSIATYFAAALLWAAAIGWILVAITEQPRSWSVVGWSALLVVLALDEGIAFHESLEKWLEVDWQILYLPVMALGALFWSRTLMRYRPSTTSRLLIAAAAVWAVALLLELVQNWGGAPARPSIYDPAMVSEEGLEMIGSMLALLAGLSALRRTVGPA